jgi:hypothetical protein
MTCDLCKGAFTADELVPIGGKNVCAKCKPELVMNLKSGVSASPRIDPLKAKEIKARISRLNLLSFALALPGIALQFLAGGLHGASQSPEEARAGVLGIQAVGAVLVILGLVCYARMKGRSGVLGLLGLLSCLGLIILNYIPKSCSNCKASAGYSAKECGTCGAPV